jgi:hypothetical protein
VAAVRRVDRDLPNIRAAVTWASAAGRSEAIAIARNQVLHFIWRSEFTDARAIIDDALRLTATRSLPWAYAMCYAGFLDATTGAADAGVARCREALTAMDHETDPVLLALAYSMLGVCAEYGGNDELAGSSYEEALIHATRAGDADAIGNILENMADLAYRDGEIERARSLALETIDRFDEVGNRVMCAASHGTVAWAAYDQQDILTTRRHTGVSIEIAHEFDNPWAMGDALLLVAALARPADGRGAA